MREISWENFKAKRNLVLDLFESTWILRSLNEILKLNFRIQLKSLILAQNKRWRRA